jgi:hypothetical protein
MRAKIDSVSWLKEYQTNFGTMHLHKISYLGKDGLYSSKNKDQTHFVVGQECEFTEETIKGKEGKSDWIKIKPLKQGGGQSNFGRALKREQSKYSGFSASYVKDMLIHGILRPEKTDEDAEHNDIVIMTWKERSLAIFEHMVELDKTLES